jgi:hypothetical protein
MVEKYQAKNIKEDGKSILELNSHDIFKFLIDI